jgi:hypothetical protein
VGEWERYFLSTGVNIEKGTLLKDLYLQPLSMANYSIGAAVNVS